MLIRVSPLDDTLALEPINEVADLLTPVYDHLCDEIRRGFAMNADETTLPCLDPEERGPGANKRKKQNEFAPIVARVTKKEVDRSSTHAVSRPNRSGSE